MKMLYNSPIRQKDYIAEDQFMIELHKIADNINDIEFY